ncbi:MAG: hypothetical protein U0556_03045 [Dehalococcoidia bacterium]
MAAFERFAAEFAALPGSPDDAVIDSLLDRHFALDVSLAPDILRGAIRRALAQTQNAQRLWDDLDAVRRDVALLSPIDRIPTPRPFADPPTGMRWGQVR